LVTLPLTLVYLAAKIATSLEHYAFEITRDVKTINSLLGWQKAMSLHNLLIFSAYLLLGFFLLTGLSWNLTWPLLLTIPLGSFEIYQIIQMAAGDKPKWQLLKWTAGGLFTIMIYLETITLFLN
jgi:hypothetical protein